MKEIGEKLKSARESKGLTINEVSVATKINPKVLQALENAALDKLPPKSFLRGFVRTYSIYLKLNTDEILKQFSEELGTTVYTTVGTQADKENSLGAKVESVVTVVEKKIEEKIADVIPKKMDIKIPPFKHGPKFFAAIGIVVLVAIVFFLKGIIEKYEKEKVVVPIEIEKQSAESTVTPANSTASTTSAQATQPATPQTVAPNAPAVVAQPASAPSAAAPVTSTPKVTPPVTTQVTAPATTPAPEPVARAGKQNVIVEALDKVTLAIRVDDGSTQKITLSPDQVHTISGQSVVLVDVSDGGAVNIIHNGKEKGVPGDLGKPIKIKFP